MFFPVTPRKGIALSQGQQKLKLGVDLVPDPNSVDSRWTSDLAPVALYSTPRHGQEPHSTRLPVDVILAQAQ